MTGLLVATVMLAASPAHFIFGAGRSWTILADGSLEAVAIIVPEAVPADVRDAAVSPDGTQVVFAAMDPTVQNVMLFRWQRATKTVERIGDQQGFHGAPVFSADGSLLRFAHHPDKGGPPGLHKEGAFAQLYEQDLSTGALNKLTDAPGCHMESTCSAATLYFAHANCMGGRRIEVLSAGKSTALTDFDDHHGEPSISLDGKRLIVTKVVGDGLALIELDPIGKKKARTLWSGMRVGDRFRPAFLKDGRVIFQIAGTVQVVGKNGNTVVASY